MSDDMAKLRNLKQLYENGLITQEEFETKKKLIVDRMTSKPVTAAAAPQQSRATTSPRATQAPATAASASPPPRPSSRPTESRATTTVPKELSKPGKKERQSDECWECGERLYGKVVTTNNHNYHMDCFCCNVCKEKLVGKTFYPQGEEVVCATHLAEGGAGDCGKCLKVIENDFVEADGVKYHPNCFVCAYGGCALDAGWSRGADGEPYCFTHLNMLNNNMCSECNKMVTKDAVTFRGRKLHARCFVCAFCQNPLPKKFYEFDGQPFCYECHRNLHYAEPVQ